MADGHGPDGAGLGGVVQVGVGGGGGVDAGGAQGGRDLV